MKNKVIFCDFNGVLSYKPFWFSLANSTHPLHHLDDTIQNLLFSEDRSIIRSWMLGDLTSEQVHAILAKQLNIDPNELFQVFVQDCQNLDISTSILNALEKLKNKYYLILATDNMDCLDRFTIPANPRIAEVFDEIYNSFNLKMFKSRQYFQQAFNKLNISPDQTILIDDSKNTCAEFNELGGKAYNVYGENEVLRVLSEL